MKDSYDIVILGSGFSAAILARILATRGRSVLMIDSAQHPRFAIGESSTPIADLLLRRLGQQYGLDDLVELSAYGSWQRSFPDLACGMKRGFSYFDHRGGHRESSIGERSMLVAASPTDERSDTHWYRPQFDAYLFAKAIDAGVMGIAGITAESITVRSDGRHKIQLSSGETTTATYIVDSTGASAATTRLLNRATPSASLTTNSCSAFAHLSGVQSFSQAFNRIHEDLRASEPFDGDDAAQHHLIGEGWVWMLRFNNEITSIGITSPIRSKDDPNTALQHSTRLIQNRFEDYPALQGILKDSQIVAPESGIVTIPRLQRLIDPVVSPSCFLTPTTAATIDPLHSTGIAHGLAGVARLAELLLHGPTPSSINRYRSAILAETHHLDRMVSMAYRSIHSFPRFTAACMVYFAAAIACEERIIAGDRPSRLWQADDEAFLDATRRCDEALRTNSNEQQAIDEVKRLLAPYNTAGLFEQADNRYAYTATK